MSKEESYAITNTKYILTVFIVCLHCSIHADRIPNVTIVYRDLDTVLMILYDCAVPAFFFLSSYLFFRNFSINDYGKKLMTRVNSLLIPYIVCSTIGFLFFVLRQLIFSDIHSLTFSDSINAILLRKYDPPIWFLLILFEYVLWTPAILILFKKLKKHTIYLLVLLLYIINLFLDKSSYVNIFYWMPLFIMGSFIGYQESQGVKIRIKWQIGLLLFPLIGINYWLYGGDLGGNVYYTYRLLGGVLAIICGHVLCWKPLPFEKYMMFVFLTHSFVHSPLLMITPPIAVLSFPRVILVITICTFTGWLLSKYTPKLYSIITGDR